MSVATVPTIREFDRARLDASVFAELLVGAPLWKHQREAAQSTARYRVICAGRQVGKSRLLAILALHEAFAVPGSRTLVVSAGEVAAQRLLDEVTALATASPLLSGAVVDETRSVLTLDNGSTVMSVPASQRQIRGWAVDLLILDEAGFIDPDIWRAAEPAIIARPGSRIVLCSSPWGSLEHFFRQLWRRGMSAPDAQVRSWHWPSRVSPLVDRKLLKEIKGREAPDYFAREYLAEWTDDGSSYFPVDELENAVADYELLDPADAEGHVAVAGVDWGFKRDANALVLVSALDDGGVNDDRHPGAPVFFIPWLEQAHRMPYAQFVDRVVEVGAYDSDVWKGHGGYHLKHVLAEENGVGEPAIQALRQAARGRWLYNQSIRGVWTTNKLKAHGYGALRLLIQQGRFVLPRHPELLKQLHSLQVEMLQGGGMRIEVPSNVGHDDLADALMQAMASVRTQPLWPEGTTWWTRSSGDEVTTTGGTVLLSRPVPLEDMAGVFTPPRAGDAQDDW